MENITLVIEIDKSCITELNSYKYCGNQFFTEHLESIKTKLLKSIPNLYKTRYYLNENALYYISNPFLTSHVRYNLFSLVRVNTSKFIEINRLINRAFTIRCINFKYLKENVDKVEIT